MAGSMAGRGFEPNALRRYELLSENTRDIVLFVHPDGHILEANRAAVLAYGYSRSELLALRIQDLRAEETRDAVGEQMARAMVEGITFETVHRRKNGSTFPVEVSSSVPGFGGMLLSMVRDITGRKRAEAVQALLRETDRRILRRERVGVILQSICDGLARSFDFPVAFIALKETDGSVRIAARAGIGSDLLKAMEVRWDETPLGMGATGQAIRTGQHQAIHLDDERALPWREAIGARGVQAGHAFPLITGGQTLGALTLYATEDRAFDGETLSMLTGFADQVAISLQVARDREQLGLQMAALEATANAVMITDREAKILWVNPAWTLMTGYAPVDAIGQTVRLLNSGMHSPGFHRELTERTLAGQTWHGEIVNRRKDGSLFTEEITITPVHDEDGDITHFVAVEQDITDRKRQEEQLRYLAMHDPVTDLPNRRTLRENMERVMGRAGRGHQSALLLLDMDNFKQVNDSLGHNAGDQVLIATAQALRRTLRPFDLVARWGGDEFAVLLEDISLEDAIATAERLRQEVGGIEPCLPGITLGVSIGVAPIDGNLGVEAVTALADFALYQAKEAGKNRVMLGHPEADRQQQLTESGQWALRIRSALQEGRLTLNFQPIVRLADNLVDHYEAFVRLVDEDGQLVSAGVLIPHAERYGLMPEIDRWVVKTVLDVLRTDPDLRVSVNLSAQGMMDDGLTAFIEAQVRERQDVTGRLWFELTEAAVAQDLAQAQTWMWRLRHLGCRFALDDFGTGFTSLSYLRSLPVESVKIDKSFIHSLHTDAANSALVAALSHMVEALGKQTIAEGVETGLEAECLREMRVEFAQGFHWGGPAPVVAKVP